MGVVCGRKQSCVAIVSEAACELLIEYFNGTASRCACAVKSAAEVRPRDSLQVRHHKSGRNSLSAHVRTKDPNSLLTEIEEVVQISPDRSRREGAACHAGPA